MNTILSTIMNEHLNDTAPTEQIRGSGKERALSMSQKDKQWESAKKFESYFLSFIYSQVKENSSDSEAEGDGQQSKMFQSMFFQEIGNKATQGGKSIGIADQIYRQMTGTGHTDNGSASAERIANSHEVTRKVLTEPLKNSSVSKPMDIDNANNAKKS